MGEIGNDKRKYSVNWCEKSLVDTCLPLEFDAMYPTYLPKEWDSSSWEQNDGQIGPINQLISSRRYFRYLHQVHNFPFRKLKLPGKGEAPPPKSQCSKYLNFDSWYHELPFPSDEVTEAFQEAILKSESAL